jgi:hypothetical protein
MAGSYRHITDKDNNFIGCGLCENLGDSHEAIEEMYYMIQYLTGGDKRKIHEAWQVGYAKHFLPKCNEPLFTYEKFWHDDD